MTATLAELTERRLDLLAAKEKIDLQIADVDAELAPLLAAHGGRYELPGLPGQGFKLATSSRFSAEKLRELIGDVAFKAASTFPPRRKEEAARVVPGALVDDCMVAGKTGVHKLTGGRRG